MGRRAGGVSAGGSRRGWKALPTLSGLAHCRTGPHENPHEKSLVKANTGGRPGHAATGRKTCGREQQTEERFPRLSIANSRNNRAEICPRTP